MPNRRTGFTWVKPMLSLFPRAGHQQTNIILANAAPVTHNFSPFLDSHSGATANERYKALGGYNDAGLWPMLRPTVSDGTS